MNLKSFGTWLVFLSLSSCQTWEPQPYEFAFKYHPRVGGGVYFDVYSHNFVEITDERIEELLKYSLIIPPKTWGMIVVDVVKACDMLGKKCSKEVQVLNSVFMELVEINSQLDKPSPPP